MSALVYLDATVVDKAGHVVTTGLTQADFSITEDGRPQRIFSFEAPEAHGGVAEAHGLVGGKANGKVGGAEGTTAGPGQGPATILVLDVLNTQYADFDFVREQAHKFLVGQPETMAAPTTLMVLGNTSFRTLEGATRSRDKLMEALDRMPRSVPFKANYQLNFASELIRQSYDALQQMSIQNRGVPGRKNVIWLGMGPPSIDDSRLSDSNREAVRVYVRDTVNLMVESRMTLFQVEPGLQVGGTSVETKGQAKQVGTGKASGESYTPFEEGNRRFTAFVDGTGGKLFNENDVGVAIAKSLDLGSRYYTLTYQPHGGDFDGRFRRIRVTLRDPNLRVLTKTGFFARDKGDAVEPEKEVTDILRDVAAATVPFSAVSARVTDVVRHPDTGMVAITVEIGESQLHWQAMGDGRSSTEITAMGVAKSAHGDVLTTRMVKLPFVLRSQNPVDTAKAKPRFKMTLPLSRETKSVRLAIAVDEGERIGAVDVDRKAIDAAPEMATAAPALQSERKNVAH